MLPNQIQLSRAECCRAQVTCPIFIREKILLKPAVCWCALTWRYLWVGVLKTSQGTLLSSHGCAPHRPQQVLNRGGPLWWHAVQWKRGEQLRRANTQRQKPRPCCSLNSLSLDALTFLYLFNIIFLPVLPFDIYLSAHYSPPPLPECSLVWSLVELLLNPPVRPLPILFVLLNQGHSSELW